MQNGHSLLKTYYVPQTLHLLYIFLQQLHRQVALSTLIDEEAKVQKGKIPYSRPQHWPMQLGFEPSSFEPQSYVLSALPSVVHCEPDSFFTRPFWFAAKEPTSLLPQLMEANLIDLFIIREQEEGEQ